MGYEFELDGDLHVVHPVYDLEETRLAVDGSEISADLLPSPDEGDYLLQIDGQTLPVSVAIRGDTQYIQIEGRVFRVEAPNALLRARRAADPSGGADGLSPSRAPAS